MVIIIKFWVTNQLTGIAVSMCVCVCVHVTWDMILSETKILQQQTTLIPWNFEKKKIILYIEEARYQENDWFRK